MSFLDDTETLPKDLILHKDIEIKEIFKSGHFIRTKYLSMHYLASDDEKVAFVISKRAGKAHRRNRIKRWLREIYRKNKQHFVGIRVIFYVKKPVDAGYEQLKDEILSKEFY
jgi:ribonuclease P protein component